MRNVKQPTQRDYLPSICIYIRDSEIRAVSCKQLIYTFTVFTQIRSRKPEGSADIITAMLKTQVCGRVRMTRFHIVQNTKTEQGNKTAVLRCFSKIMFVFFLAYMPSKTASLTYISN